MRILIVGAGALGGYFGAYLAAAGRDATFLVRPARAAALARDGLQVLSPHGNITIAPKTVTADTIDGPYDVILVGVKAYSLPDAMNDMARAVAGQTAILPVINGMRHIDDLCARFGPEHLLGGVARVSAALDATGRVVLHLPNPREIEFGELSGAETPRLAAIAAAFDVPGFQSKPSPNIRRDLWEKWAMLATNAGITCLMRAAIGDILASPGGREAIAGLMAECRAVAAASGFAPRPEFIERINGMFMQEGSPLKASMLRDIEAGNPAEGEHILGDLAQRGHALGVATPILDLARCHVAAYMAARARAG